MSTLRTSPKILVPTPAGPLPVQAFLSLLQLTPAAQRGFKTTLRAIDSMSEALQDLTSALVLPAGQAVLPAVAKRWCHSKQTRLSR